MSQAKLREALEWADALRRQLPDDSETAQAFDTARAALSEQTPDESKGEAQRLAKLLRYYIPRIPKAEGEWRAFQERAAEVLEDFPPETGTGDAMGEAKSTQNPRCEPGQHEWKTGNISGLWCVKCGTTQPDWGGNSPALPSQQVTSGQQGWISVNDRLPEGRFRALGVVWVDDEAQVCEVLHYDDGLFMHDFCTIGEGSEDWSPEDYRLDITHWMPLPPPPEAGTPSDHSTDKGERNG